MLLLPPGDLERLEMVGCGGFGNVYRGWSQTLKMEVALKVVQEGHSSNLKKLTEDLMKERDVMQKASNPHVLRLLGVYEKVEGSLVEHGLVMEYMPHGSLHTLFDDIPTLPWALRFQILHQVVLGMNYLHSLNPPIIHRDLKPCNVLLNKHLDVQVESPEEGTDILDMAYSLLGRCPTLILHNVRGLNVPEKRTSILSELNKITDFGLSKIIGATTSSVPSFAGTLSYMPPEALNDINYKPSKSYDVYSFGILAWTVFSGEEPYPGIPSAIIMRCVTKGQRPAVSVLDRYRDVRMVPEAKDLMIRCWDPNAENRPSFHDCSECTSVMYDAYQKEMRSAVRSVEDHLTNMGSSAQQAESSGYISGATEEYLNALENGGMSQESKPLDRKAAGKGRKPPTARETVGKTNKNKKDLSNTALENGGMSQDSKPLDRKAAEKGGKPPTAHETVGKTNKNKKDISNTGGVMNKLAGALTSPGGYKKITGMLTNELLSKENQQKISSSKHLKDYDYAAKIFREKLREEPPPILPLLKSIFYS
ncbi:receptor-interacting serine/threonine-protein kinase 3-like isoform X2 [Lithobates pipiens]